MANASLHVKKGDLVRIIAGDNKGKTGKVIALNVAKCLVKVHGIAIVTRHFKARREGEKSGIKLYERFIHASNVMLVESEK